jgi:CCR4-NOT transcription complex subunit 7/8
MDSSWQFQDVWAWNLHEEFGSLVAAVAGESGVVMALDTEFPGLLWRLPQDIGDAQLAQEAKYRVLCKNIDSVWPIQVGIAVTHRGGAFTRVWNFHLNFDLSADLHTKASVELLRSAGLDFERHAAEGIDPMCLGGLMASSLLFGWHRHAPLWVTFSGEYDLGFLLKLLVAGAPLPQDRTMFDEVLMYYFPQRFELRSQLPYGSLESCAQRFSLIRRGQAHTAGSDALLTLELYQSVVAATGCDPMQDQINSWGASWTDIHEFHRSRSSAFSWIEANYRGPMWSESRSSSWNGFHSKGNSWSDAPQYKGLYWHEGQLRTPSSWHEMCSRDTSWHDAQSKGSSWNVPGWDAAGFWQDSWTSSVPAWREPGYTMEQRTAAAEATTGREASTTATTGVALPDSVSRRLIERENDSNDSTDSNDTSNGGDDDAAERCGTPEKDADIVEAADVPCALPESTEVLATSSDSSTRTDSSTRIDASEATEASSDPAEATDASDEVVESPSLSAEVSSAVPVAAEKNPAVPVAAEKSHRLVDTCSPASGVKSASACGSTKPKAWWKALEEISLRPFGSFPLTVSFESFYVLSVFTFSLLLLVLFPPCLSSLILLPLHMVLLVLVRSWTSPSQPSVLISAYLVGCCIRLGAAIAAATARLWVSV